MARLEDTYSIDIPLFPFTNIHYYINILSYNILELLFLTLQLLLLLLLLLYLFYIRNITLKLIYINIYIYIHIEGLLIEGDKTTVNLMAEFVVDHLIYYLVFQSD